ncbi:hypothetical protein [Variovorax saccharolyticus]|uniref:hypothetical protein n=1 Tax=Variovorax saccharolyticus TaxID=3053516 RepID=UPI002576A7C3|nr:hypothetical protein [Variovorax sp. J22R187]MDM0018019.1 hypothetical protein [Variovorax sp. J22R187]
MTILLSRQEIERQLKSRWADEIQRSPRFSVYVPSMPSGEEAARMLQGIEKQISEPLPSSFVEAAMQWDLGRLVLGAFPFASDGDYLASLLKLNAATPGCEWWGDRDECERPAGLLAISHGDPFMVLLDTSTGAIYAHAADDGSANTRLVAPSLDLFLRAVGTTLLTHHDVGNRQEFVDALVVELIAPKGRPFWEELAMMSEPA